MYAKYIKREVADLNGTGRTQACYKMELQSMNFQQFVNLCHREGKMDESQILGVLSLVALKYSIMVNGVSYRADKELIRNTDRKCTLVRGGESRLKKSPFTQEERIQKAREYMKAHLFMKVPDYVQLTGLSRSTAAEELRKLASDPSTGITSRGQRSQKLYILRPEAVK